MMRLHWREVVEMTVKKVVEGVAGVFVAQFRGRGRVPNDGEELVPEVVVGGRDRGRFLRSLQ